MKLDLLAQPSLRADAIAVADEEHSDHELGVDRRSSNLAVEGFQLLVQIGEHRRDKHVHAPQQMVRRNAILEAELVEQLPLIPLPPPHHRRVPAAEYAQRTESAFGGPHKPFIDNIGQQQTTPI